MKLSALIEADREWPATGEASYRHDVPSSVINKTPRIMCDPDGTHKPVAKRESASRQLGVDQTTVGDATG
jgi:hypothetical protein